MKSQPKQAYKRQVPVISFLVKCNVVIITTRQKQPEMNPT